MNCREIVFRPQAQRDVVEIGLYVAEENPHVADMLFDAIEDACDMLATLPEIGSLRQFDNPELEGLRLWPIKRFDKYLIFSRATEHTLDVIRVIHGARDFPTLFDP